MSFQTNYIFRCPAALHQSMNYTMDAPLPMPNPGSRGLIGMGSYVPLVDLLGHPELGDKGMLHLIDGLYGGQSQNHAPPTFRWKQPPFNGQWPCSLFASQDPVALDSVGFDFLYNEPTQVKPRLGAPKEDALYSKGLQKFT